MQSKSLTHCLIVPDPLLRFLPTIMATIKQGCSFTLTKDFGSNSNLEPEVWSDTVEGRVLALHIDYKDLIQAPCFMVL